jgi:hypothetical protein
VAHGALLEYRFAGCRIAFAGGGNKGGHGRQACA